MIFQKIPSQHSNEGPWWKLKIRRIWTVCSGVVKSVWRVPRITWKCSRIRTGWRLSGFCVSVKRASTNWSNSPESNRPHYRSIFLCSRTANWSNQIGRDRLSITSCRIPRCWIFFPRSTNIIVKLGVPQLKLWDTNRVSLCSLRKNQAPIVFRGETSRWRGFMVLRKG